MGLGLDLDFGSADGRAGLNGVFEEDGIVGMLEARDFRNIDQVSPFIGAILDRLCGETMSAPCTTVFTLFVDMVQFVTRARDKHAWTPEL